MTDRIADALIVFRAELARADYLGVYEYTVQSSGPGTVDVVPTGGHPFPPLTGVPLVSSLLGQTATPAATGAPCRIRFVNGDPSRPVCVGIAAPSVVAAIDASGALALGPDAQRVVLAGGAQQVAREGDAVTILLPPGILTSGAGTLTILSAMSGIIGSGSKATA